MQAHKISVGDTLRLTKDGAARYGMSTTERYTVTAIATRGHYKTPWIYVGNGWAFRPSDLRP